MGIATIAAVFATENLVDAIVSRFIPLKGEIITWLIVAIIASIIVYKVGEDRGDW